MNKNILVLGVGEIGNSVIDLYSPKQTLTGSYTVYYKDIYNNTSKGINIQSLTDYIAIDVLHVCIPFTKDFIDSVIFNIKTYTPSMVYIHSTVDIGVTRRIGVQTDCTDCIVCHTPVMGVHPNLTESMQIFKKIVGTMKKEDRQSILEHFNSIRLTPEFYDSPEDSEAAKLFSTTYYGHVIRFMQDTHKFCEKNNLDFDSVYTRTNEIYNEGYTKMNMEYVRRPILKYQEGKIGGHCIISNAEILKDNFLLAKWLVEHNANL